MRSTEIASLLLSLYFGLPLCCWGFQLEKSSRSIRYVQIFESSSTSIEPSSEASSADDVCRTPHVVVVGGGVGGLAVAARVASNNYCRVTLVEKNKQVGGRCGSFVVDIPSMGRFRHERGPSLLLLPNTYREIFQECGGHSAEDFGLEMSQCVPAYQVIFDDGDSISVGFPRGKLDPKAPQELESRAIMNSYEKDGAAKWDDYMRACNAFLDCGLPNFIEENLDLESFPAFLVEALKDFAQNWPLKPHSDVLDAIFESEKMKALASFQDLYVGLEPYRNNALLGGGVIKSTAPAVFGLLAAIELHPYNTKSGVFAPRGGFQAVTDALEGLARKMGVDIQTEKTVLGIQDDGIFVCDSENNEACLPTKKEFLSADLIIVNADLPYASKSLLLDGKNENVQRAISTGKPILDWDDKFCYSSGVIAFHWSIAKSLDELQTHNVFLVAGSRSQSEASWTVLRTNQGDYDAGEDTNPATPFNFYVHRAGCTDPSAVSTGYDSLMVLVPCRTLLRDEDCARLPKDEALKMYQTQFTDKVVSQAREAVLIRLAAVKSLRNLKSHICDEVVDTPITWAEQYNLAAGTPFGLSHGFGQLSVKRPGPEYIRGKLPNVLFCGASSRPGNGVPLVLIGAKQVAEKAAQKLKTTAVETNE